MKKDDHRNGDTLSTVAKAQGNPPQRLYLGWVAWGVLVGLLVLTRLLPYALPRVLERLFGLDGQALAYHMFNVTPLGAGTVFGGAVFASRVQALALPLAVWAISDALLTLMGWAPIPGFGHVLVQYPLFLAMAVVGMWWLRTKMNAWRMLGACLASGILFLLVVDFNVWLRSRDVPLPPQLPDSYWGRLLFAFRPDAFLFFRGYPKTLDGLITCYLMGLPFSLRFIGSTLSFGLVFYLAYVWVTERARTWAPSAAATPPLSQQ
ncbi:MAG: DUF6580 family putative transport protein [Gemmatales bacterium]|nr:hypothetical protein [Gemmatales bacterium]MDW7995548.1 DUF6580 family putative transport protein [Gemmatales bacterium]